LLEDRFHLLLVNARHIKAVPGRKTDIRDCEWLADLLRHGLLRPSFVPERPQRELRELTRYRLALVQARTAEANRLQKTLESANIKLAAVATDILGVSGRQILNALVEGTTEPETLADLAKGALRSKIPQLQQALVGRVGAHQRFLIAEHLAQLDSLEASIARVSTEIADRLRPLQETIARLDTIPGIGCYLAEALVAEIGTDMTRFASAAHLASWAGMCPGNNESAGKRRSGKTRKGNPWLRALLVQAAHAAARRKNTYFAAQYARVSARRGKKRAAVAVGHTILIVAYYLLQRGTEYQELGPHWFDQQDRHAVERRLVRRLEALGNKVILEPTEPAA
jgi:transposase